VKRKQRNRLKTLADKETDKQIQALNSETRNFMNYLYYKDLNEFLDSIGKQFHEKVNSYRICLAFGFQYDKELNKLRTSNPDVEENEMLTMLKDIIGINNLVFNYKKKEEIIEEEPVEPSKFPPIM
jgi:hypothetical protein